MTEKNKHILITNDDGISAEGLKHLIEIISKDYKITVVAPESPQSGKSHSITSGQPIRINNIPETNGISKYSCQGTPVDCVKIAMNTILNEKPDLILSGINAGSNTGSSVFYSGTVGAAVEGSFFKIPSIALSLCLNGKKPDYKNAKDYIADIIEMAFTNLINTNKCLNVNIPNTEIKGIKICRQTKGAWKEKFEKRIDPQGNDYFWLSGYYQNDEPEATDTDEWAVNNGYISIVPIQTDLTDKDCLNFLNNSNL